MQSRLPHPAFSALCLISGFTALLSFFVYAVLFGGHGSIQKAVQRSVGKDRLPVNPSGWKVFRQGGLAGYKDSTGRITIAPRFLEAGAFEEGVAAVATKVVAELGGHYEMRFGAIDTSGRFVIPPSFRYISHFHEGLAIASLDGKRFGYIDHQGRWILPPRFAEASDFESGLAHVLPLGELSFSVVDTAGRLRPVEP